MGEKKLHKQTDGRMDRQTDSQANNNGLIGKSNKQYLRFFNKKKTFTISATFLHLYS